MCIVAVFVSVYFLFAAMDDGTLELTVLLEFAKQGFELWSEFLGSNILERAANTTWKHMTTVEGGAGRLTEALTCLFPEQIGDHQKLWNLLTAYELWSGHILTAPALVFVQDGLSTVLEPGWEVQLQQYRNGFVEKMRAGRETRPGVQTTTQSGKSGGRPPVDSFATEPS